MSQDKIKTYKNPDRENSTVHKPYIPQYQILGLEPKEYKSSVVPVGTPVASGNLENPRIKKTGLRQPYAKNTESPVGAGKGPLPNVGNNIEQTWSSVDGELVDDLQDIDNNHQMIDNNDYVTDTALGQAGMKEMPSPATHPANKSSKNDTDDLLSIVNDLAEDNYLLIVSGVAICSGPALEIEEQATALVFGEHEFCDGNPLPVEEIMIIKKVPIKMGLFLG